MKICWFGIYDKKYSRNDILMSGLRENGAEIVECAASAKERGRYAQLSRRLKTLRGQYDLVYAAYPAPVPTIVAKLVSDKPVWMDAFYSMYDAVVNDRREIPWFHPRALKLALLDWLALVLADRIVVDTEAHRRYWGRWLFVRASKITVVYLGVNPAVYHPLPAPPRSGGTFLVHFHGTGIPLQGIEKIIEAAALLTDDDAIRFRILGLGGGHKNKLSARASELGLRNVEFLDRVPPEELNRYLNDADAVLGIFGDTAKAQRVIPNKVYEGAAVGKPVVTMDTPAVREVFSDEELLLIESNSKAIAAAIKKLQGDPIFRERLAQNAYARVQTGCVPQNVAEPLFSEMSAA